jgi:predicted DNA-binding protein
MDKDQFLLRPNKRLIERLKNLAVKFGKASGQQVAVEVIEQYLDFWEEAESAKQATIKRQRESIQMKPKSESHIIAASKKKPAKKTSKPNNGS